MSSFFKRLTANRHFQHGVPFFLFIGGGAFMLKEFRTVRYDSKINPKANKFVTPEEAFGSSPLANPKSPVQFQKSTKTLEEELEEYNKTVDLDNWENKRGPRPWEGTVPAKPVNKRLQKPPPLVEESLETK